MKVAGLIFSGMYSDGLDYLTKNRTTASLPFGGRYRQIDFVLSNMVNSKIFDIGVITKYNYQSLIDHLGSYQDWDLNRKRGGLMLIPPFATSTSGGYRGKIDELRAALPFLKKRNSEYVVLSGSDFICSIDFRKIIHEHISSGRDISIVASKIINDETSESELVFDSHDGKSIEDIYLNYYAKTGQYSSLSMYIMKREFLIENILSLTAKGFYHFERDFIQKEFNKKTLNVGISEFHGLVLKNRDISEYFNNSLKMKYESVRQEIFKKEAPIYTTVRDEAPTYYGENSVVSDCIIADGCKIEGKVENSVLFRGINVGKNTVVRNSIIMAGCVISDGAVVENAIIDKEVHVSKLRKIIGAPHSPTVIQKGETI